MMIPDFSEIKSFRQALYSLFPKRKDAIMNLLDALTSYGHQADSVVQLSLADCFNYQYSSITDAIADGLPHANWNEIMKLLYAYANQASRPNTFLVDCTAQPRPYARKLEDRTITHLPNPAPGNKPICVGHQYSLVALLPQAAEKHWLIPMSFKRIASDKKGNEEGIKQIIDCIKTLGMSNEINISIGDSLYGTENCRITAAEQDNLIHVFRLNSKRNVYFAPTVIAEKGRKKEFGEKMLLNGETADHLCEQQIEIPWISCKGKEYRIIIKSWSNVLLRGSRKFRSSHHPINLVQATAVNSEGKMIFKRPLWLAVFGKKRNELSPIDVYKKYIKRYDIEHFFRYGKQKLLLHAYQTSDVEHESLWWQFCLLAYMQLYLAKSIISSLPQPWEQYLPEYKNNNSNNCRVLTPSQTQRGFAALLQEIGSPAHLCIARGKPCGRMLGMHGIEKPDQAIIFKSKKTFSDSQKTILSGSEKKINCSNPKKIDALINLIKIWLEQTNFSPSQFAEVFLNSS